MPKPTLWEKIRKKKDLFIVCLIRPKSVKLGQRVLMVEMSKIIAEGILFFFSFFLLFSLKSSLIFSENIKRHLLQL